MDQQQAEAGASHAATIDGAAAAAPLPPPPPSSCGPILAETTALAMPSLGPNDEEEEEEEAWLVGEVRALAARLAHGAVLRPRAAALLAEAEAQVEGHLTALSAIGADAAQAVAQIQALRLQLLLPPPLPRTAPDEAHARMEAGGEEEDPELEAVDGLLAALRARAEVQASQARAVGDGWKEELRARRALHRAVVSAAAAAGGQSGAAVEGPKAMMEQAEGEEEDRVWALLAERLKQLGVHRLAAALRECASLGGSSRPGSSCGGGGGSFSLPSSAHPTPGHSRPGSAASLLACVPEMPPPSLDAHDEEGEDGEGPLQPPSLPQLQQSQSQSQRRERVPSLASLGSASSWVELRENGVEALRLQVETEAARAAALRLAIAREQEAAQQAATVAQALLQREQQRRLQRQQAARMLVLVGRLRRYAAARVLGLARRAETRAVGRAWRHWRRAAVKSRQPKGDTELLLSPLAPPPLPAHVPSVLLDAMEQGGGDLVGSNDDEGAEPLAPPPLPAHAPSAALVAMEEGDAEAAAGEGGGANTQVAPAALPSPPLVQGQEKQEGERPWARLRLVTPEAAAALEGVARALEEGQRRLEALAAQLTAAGAARRAAVAGITTTTSSSSSFNPEGEEVQVQAQLLPPQDPAVAALLERARAMAAQAVAEIFRGLRLEDGAGEGMEDCCALDVAAITADASGEEDAAPAGPTTTAEEGDQPVTAASAAAGPALTRGESASGRGMGAVRAAMVEGLYEAMRERLACQAEEVAQLEALLARCQRLNGEMERRTEDLRLRAAAVANAAATTTGVIGQEEDLEQQQHLLLQGAAGASAALAATTDAQLGALQARLKLFAARALGDWGLVLERRRLRRAWSAWVVQAWE